MNKLKINKNTDVWYYDDRVELIQSGRYEYTTLKVDKETQRILNEIYLRGIESGKNRRTSEIRQLIIGK